MIHRGIQPTLWAGLVRLGARLQPMSADIGQVWRAVDPPRGASAESRHIGQLWTALTNTLIVSAPSQTHHSAAAQQPVPKLRNGRRVSAQLRFAKRWGERLFEQTLVWRICQSGASAENCNEARAGLGTNAAALCAPDSLACCAGRACVPGPRARKGWRACHSQDAPDPRPRIRVPRLQRLPRIRGSVRRLGAKVTPTCAKVVSSTRAMYWANPT